MRTISPRPPRPAPRAQIMKNLEAVHFILNEMAMCGNMVEIDKQNVMAPIML